MSQLYGPVGHPTAAAEKTAQRQPGRPRRVTEPSWTTERTTWPFSISIHSGFGTYKQSKIEKTKSTSTKLSKLKCWNRPKSRIGTEHQ
ncbi:unnamed protein product [Nesidiocoris tenuis]|uniref:Uncharacterized protein n=1 Tax=Nesidiocoris tenuis TaxID=355587 RepID=A0A6H5G0X2_9HEMI|nr:unnamed protein product [Nesidiocoris tenuis]